MPRRLLISLKSKIILWGCNFWKLAFTNHCDVICYAILFTAQVKPALPALARLIHSNDEEVLTDACWALSYLSDGTNDKIQAVIEAGVCPRLVELLLWVLRSSTLLSCTYFVVGCVNLYIMHSIIQFLAIFQPPISFCAHSCSSYGWKYCDWRWYADSGIGNLCSLE